MFQVTMCASSRETTGMHTRQSATQNNKTVWYAYQTVIHTE